MTSWQGQNFTLGVPGNTSILSSGLAEEVSVARSIAVNASTGAERAMKAVRMAQAAVDEVRATVEGSKESDTIANIAKEVDNLNQTLMEQLVELSEREDRFLPPEMAQTDMNLTMNQFGADAPLLRLADTVA